MMSESSRTSRILSVAAFFVGLAVVVWVASGFVGTGAFALGMTVLIGLGYLAGAWEVRQFSQETRALEAAVRQVPQPLAQLADWLVQVPEGLRDAVRRRVDGERVALPGLGLTPYLLGLLVMLGMLGTFLGMVITFKGAVFALEGSADLSAIRSALAAPIKGLGLSFGTSVAGVATSAMLGLMASLARRERARVMRGLDHLQATTLRTHSAAHARQQGFEALQRQADTFPEAARHLQTLIDQMERRSQQLDEQLLARQTTFQSEAVAAYTQLAQSVELSLKHSLMGSTQAATDSLAPIVRQAMQDIAASSAQLQERVSQTVGTQLAELSSRFEASTAAVAQSWTGALATQAKGHEQLMQGLTQSLDAFRQRFGQHADRLLQQVQSAQEQAHAQRLESDQAQRESLAATSHALNQSLQRAWQGVADQAQGQQQAIVQTLERTATEMLARHGEQVEQGLQRMSHLVASSEALVQARTAAEAEWTQAHGQRMDELTALWRAELAALREEESQRAQLAGERMVGWQGEWAQSMRQLRDDEAARGAAAVERLSDLQSALSTQLATLGNALEAPMARLMQTASDAPKAAAEVIAQLREQMSRLAERDNATLAERADLVGQISALLQQVQQTTGEQRMAIEHLVGSATGVLDRVGQQFAESVDAQAGRAESLADQAAASAAQLASLGDAFQQGAQQLAASHEQLVQNLQRVETAIDRSMARSDEQLAYYVAQAREVVDLSISAQQGILEDLRQLRQAGPAAAVAGGAA